MDLAQLTTEIRQHLKPVEHIDIYALGQNNYRLALLIQEQSFVCFLKVTASEIILTHQGYTAHFDRFERPFESENKPDCGDIKYTPMNATLVEFPVKVGQCFDSGDLLYTLSSMKMRMRYYANEKIEITAVHAKVGDPLKQGQHLLDWKEIQHG